MVAKDGGSLSFIMAGYNEEDNVLKAVQMVYEAIGTAFHDFEIILVDDGSKDSTLKLMHECENRYPQVKVIENKVNLNYGASVLRGLKEADKEWVVYDAFDMEMHPADFCALFAGKEETADVIVFERETYEATAWRQLASFLNKALLHIMFPILMRGTPCLNHTQAFRRSVVDEIIPLSRSPIFFSPEIVFRAKLKGFRVDNRLIRFNSIDGIRSGAFGNLYNILWAVNDMFRFRWRLWWKKI